MRIRWLLIGMLAVVVLATGYFLATPRSLPLGIHTLHADDNALQQVSSLGAGYIVQVFAWRDIEPTQGEFHWEYTDWLVRAAEYYHLRIIARLDKPPKWAASTGDSLSAPPRSLDQYADFVGRVAARYRGRIPAYIIWNEPNLAREWGNQRPDPAAYVELLGVAASAVRAADPQARVVSAGLAPTNEVSERALDDRTFLREMYAAGARGSFDVLGAHPYGFANPPGDPRGAHLGLNFARLQDLRDIMVANGDERPMWITEFGYTTAATQDAIQLQVDATRQAEYLAAAYEMARSRWSWVQLFAVWNLAQAESATEEEMGYSLKPPDGANTPAWNAVGAMPKNSPLGELIGRTADAASALVVPAPTRDLPVLARDAVVHLGDSDYPLPWVPLYLVRNPSAAWQGEFYLRSADLEGAERRQDWLLTVELMQVNDLSNEIRVNDQVLTPRYVPAEPNFTSVWVTARLHVPFSALHVGKNTVTFRDTETYPAFQQPGFTWDDLQLRNVILHAP